MKRLLCIVSSLDTGGAETFMMKIFRSLPEEYKLDFIVSADTGYYEDEVQHLGGIIYRVPLRTKYPLKTYRSIKNIVKDNKYERVLKLCDTPIGLFDLLACKAGGAKRICVRSCNASSDESRIKRVINNIIRPLFNRVATVKIAPSILAAEYTFGKKAVEKKDVYFLHNAVDLNVYKYNPQGRKNIRREFGITEEQFVVGHIGRFNKQKNHSFLLDIFAEIKKNDKDSVLILVGDGEKEDDIRMKVTELELQDSVIFTGIRADIPELLSAMDIFVFPSFYEGMPNTVIEAQAAGLSCVISDTITKEVGITEAVKFQSIKTDPKEWIKDILVHKGKNRWKTEIDLQKHGYDIKQVWKEFVQLIFE